MEDFQLSQITLRDYVTIGHMHTRAIMNGAPDGYSAYSVSAALTLVPHIGVLVETPIIPFVQVATLTPEDPRALKMSLKSTRKAKKIRAKLVDSKQEK